MELRWQPSVDVSALHAAWAVAMGRRLIDPAFQEELEPAVAQLEQLAKDWKIPPQLYWRQLLTLAADIPSNQQLAERLLTRLMPSVASTHTTSQLSAAISGCEAIVRRRFPNMLEELNLRSGPLRLAWEARGPGLLYMLGQLTQPDFIVEAATILLVQPVVGGDGMAHITTNRVHIETLLTDADSRLPETLRLAWMLGQLNLDRPTVSENVHGHRLAEVAEMALLPAVLAAAENVQLAQHEPQTLQLALALWLRKPEEELEATANVLAAWWETATEAGWPWSTSLTALSHMLVQA